MDNRLGESHRRVIASGLLVVDSAAVRILDLLDNRNAASVMRLIEGSVNADEKEHLRIGLLRLQELISVLVLKYDLDPTRKDLRRILTADVSQIWVSLEDCRPARIRGYGAIPASTAKVLETDLQELLRIAHGLLALLSS
jgi:hypothetical protein